MITKQIKFYLIAGIVLAVISSAVYFSQVFIGYGTMKESAKVNKVTSVEVERQADRAAGLHTTDVAFAHKTARKMIHDEEHKSSWANTCMPDDIARSHGWLLGCKDRSSNKKSKSAIK